MEDAPQRRALGVVAAALFFSAASPPATTVSRPIICLAAVPSAWVLAETAAPGPFRTNP